MNFFPQRSHWKGLMPEKKVRRQIGASNPQKIYVLNFLVKMPGLCDVKNYTFSTFTVTHALYNLTRKTICCKKKIEKL